MKRGFSVVIVVGCWFLALAGCEQGPGPTAAPEAPVIPVSHAIKRSVTNYVDYTGRTNAKNSVAIVPRVTGYLVQMPFKEGAEVKKGDLLFEIDPRPYQAQYEAALSQVAQNEASLRYAKATNERFKTLSKKQPGAVAERELDQYQALEDQSVATLKLSNANLGAAKLNLDWTKVYSPIDGQVSRYYLTNGNLVNQDQTQLTTVVSIDPMYAYFDIDEPTFVRIKAAIQEGTIKVKNKKSTSPISTEGAPEASDPVPAANGGVTEVPVLMGLQGEEGYPHQGSLNFVDNQLNSATGSISVRGIFSNPKLAQGTSLLAPGMFVRVRLPIGHPHDSLLVIDRAITSDQGLKFVYVVDAENKAQMQKISIGALQEDGLREINGGLKDTDWIVVGAIQQVRPRMVVQPEQVTMPTLGTAATKEPGAPGAAQKKKKGKG